MCYHQAAVLRDNRSAIEELGYRLVVVGIGNPDGAAKFTEAVPFPGDALLLDPERSMHDSFSLKCGLGATFFNKATPEAIKKYSFAAFRDAAKNYAFVPPPSNEAALQQGGLFVFDGHEVLYSHIDEGTADHAPIEDVLAALRT